LKRATPYAQHPTLHKNSEENMNRDIAGLILSFVFVFFMIFIATLIQKLFKLSNEFSRKIIHIAVGHWILIALYYFEDWYIAIIGPAAFILINFLSYKFTIFKAMELEERNPGTVYYAVSLTICTLLTYSQKPLLILPYLGIMAMTWGDGMAAVMGKKWPVRHIRPGKSIGGSTAFFMFTLLASIFYLLLEASNFSMGLIIIYALCTALAGVLIELFSPKNLDNLTVPIILGLIGFLVGI
jgi:phytol kinase